MTRTKKLVVAVSPGKIHEALQVTEGDGEAFVLFRLERNTRDECVYRVDLGGFGCLPPAPSPDLIRRTLEHVGTKNEGRKQWWTLRGSRWVGPTRNALFDKVPVYGAVPDPDWDSMAPPPEARS